MAFAADFRVNANLIGESSAEQLSGRLRAILAILRAIEDGELLSDLPAEPCAREAHAVGLSLLEVMAREIAAVIAEIERVGSLRARSFISATNTRNTRYDSGRRWALRPRSPAARPPATGITPAAAPSDFGGGVVHDATPIRQVVGSANRQGGSRALARATCHCRARPPSCLRLGATSCSRPPPV
jgi:hypothetical protein